MRDECYAVSVGVIDDLIKELPRPVKEATDGDWRSAVRNGYVRKRIRTITRKYFAKRSDAQGNLYRLIAEESSEPVEYELRKKDLKIGLEYAISVAKAECAFRDRLQEEPEVEVG